MASRGYLSYPISAWRILSVLRALPLYLPVYIYIPFIYLGNFHQKALARLRLQKWIVLFFVYSDLLWTVQSCSCIPFLFTFLHALPIPKVVLLNKISKHNPVVAFLPLTSG